MMFLNLRVGWLRINKSQRDIAAPKAFVDLFID